MLTYRAFVDATVYCLLVWKGERERESIFQQMTRSSCTTLLLLFIRLQREQWQWQWHWTYRLPKQANIKESIFIFTWHHSMRFLIMCLSNRHFCTILQMYVKHIFVYFPHQCFPFFFLGKFVSFFSGHRPTRNNSTRAQNYLSL